MNENWIEVGKLTDIPRLGARIVQSPEGEIALFRNADDEVFALRNQCPHKGGPLAEGIVAGHRVTCPLHNWRIELESGSAMAPDVGCTPSFPIRLEGAAIYLSLQAANGC